MREDEVVSSLGPTEKKLFDIQTQTVIDKVNDPEKAIELTKQ
jgi:exonuclease VII large subunit